MGAKKVYDQVNSESGHVFLSSSQSKELRDTWQIYRQSINLKKESHGHLQGELESIINFERAEKGFVNTVTCIRDRFYVFLGTTVQLNDVAKFCCEMHEVLYIDNLLIFVNTGSQIPVMVTYGLKLTRESIQYVQDQVWFVSKEVNFLNRFISEMCSYQSNIRSLKTIDADQDRATYNGFSDELPELNLLLYIFHLGKGDREKLLQLNPSKGAVKGVWDN